MDKTILLEQLIVIKNGNVTVTQADTLGTGGGSTSSSNSSIKKYSTNFGDGVASSFNITHTLDTTDISHISIKNIATGEIESFPVKVIDKNTININGGSYVPTTNQYRVTITG